VADGVDGETLYGKAIRWRAWQDLNPRPAV